MAKTYRRKVTKKQLENQFYKDIKRRYELRMEKAGKYNQKLVKYDEEQIKEMLEEERQFIGSVYKDDLEFINYWGDKLARDQVREYYQNANGKWVTSEGILSNMQIANMQIAAKEHGLDMSDVDWERVKYDKAYAKDIFARIQAFVEADPDGMTIAQFFGSL